MTHYEVLGVLPTATTEEINKAFRSLAYLHPDRQPQDKSAPARFAAITEAHAVLTNVKSPTSRAEYDAQPSETASMEAASFAIDLATELVTSVREANPTEIVHGLFSKAQTPQGRQEIRSAFDFARTLFRAPT